MRSWSFSHENVIFIHAFFIARMTDHNSFVILWDNTPRLLARCIAAHKCIFFYFSWWNIWDEPFISFLIEESQSCKMQSPVKYFIKWDRIASRIYCQVIYQRELQMRHFSGSYRYLNRLWFQDKRSNSLSWWLAQFQAGRIYVTAIWET